MSIAYKRILLKLSGEVLAGEAENMQKRQKGCRYGR